MAACGPGSGSDTRSNELLAFEGAFGAAPLDAVVTFSEREGALLMHPALWSGPMVLARVDADSFVVREHPRFGVAFVWNDGDYPDVARVHGLEPGGEWTRIDRDSRRPVQLLMDDHPEAAARAYIAADDVDAGALEVVVRRRLQSAPSHLVGTVAFARAVVDGIPDHPGLLAALGDALVWAGRREEARVAYHGALELDPGSDAALTALQRLDDRGSPEEAGWQLPFDVEDVLAVPDGPEIDSAWDDWRSRNLDPVGARVTQTLRIELEGVPTELRVVEHHISGFRHLGVVMVPEGADAGMLPVLVEAKGVSPDFFPLEAPGGMTSPRFMAGVPVILAAPGYRGEQIVVGEDTLASEGDRTNAWDGAADDLVAFLRAALDVTPEADSSRICVFGRSRGGTVALLAGMREPAIDCVVSWAAPTDWFRLMDLGGWTQAELVRDGLRHGAMPGETGGQFINYFLGAALGGEADLGATRRRMILSSPLYFAGRLPLAQTHWGIEDTIVPVANGEEFVDAYRVSGRSGECMDARFHPLAGHDQDRQRAPRQSRDFIVRAFGLSDGEISSCRP